MHQALAVLQKGWGTHIPFVPLHGGPPSLHLWMARLCCWGLSGRFLSGPLAFISNIQHDVADGCSKPTQRTKTQLCLWKRGEPDLLGEHVTAYIFYSCADNSANLIWRFKGSLPFSRCKTLHSATAGIQMFFHMSDITGCKVYCCIYKKQHWH